MSAEVFMRLTPRFSASYMEIREVQNCVFASFSLGWSASHREEWRRETTLNTFPELGFEFEGSLVVEGWIWQSRDASLPSRVVLISKPWASGSFLIDSLSELYCFSNFVLGFVLSEHHLLNSCLPPYATVVNWQWSAQSRRPLTLPGVTPHMYLAA